MSRSPRYHYELTPSAARELFAVSPPDVLDDLRRTIIHELDGASARPIDTRPDAMPSPYPWCAVTSGDYTIVYRALTPEDEARLAEKARLAGREFFGPPSYLIALIARSGATVEGVVAQTRGPYRWQWRQQ